MTQAEIILSDDKYSNSGSLYIAGGIPLKGSLKVRGAKNSVPKNMVASLLTDATTIIKNVAEIRDVSIMRDMITSMGGHVETSDSGSVLEINSQQMRPLTAATASYFSGISRIPILLCGPLLHRFGQAIIPGLGGCSIGERPIDFHLTALRKFGANMTEDSDGIKLSCKKLRGAKIKLDYPSVGATEQVILTAVLAQGETELSNAAVEPEILDIIGQLQKMGARIYVEADRTIRINGVDNLTGCSHIAMPDRLEVASWACAAIATNGEIFVEGARHHDLFSFLNTFLEMGGGFEVKENGILFRRDAESIKAVTIETNVHPGFMTDWQQPLATALTQAEGISVIHETVYEGRFGYVNELNRMGAKIHLRKECLGSRCRFGRLNHEHSAIIQGKTPLQASEISIPDLRAGFSYVIAGLIAEGTSKINNIGLIQRGYENFLPKLEMLGASAKIGV